MSDPIPAITEAAATGEIATIFADIRHVMGVDIVNLVWRHLATIDGALPWAWRTLRPLYIDGSVISEATNLHAELALPSTLIKVGAEMHRAVRHDERIVVFVNERRVGAGNNRLGSVTSITILRRMRHATTGH